MNEEIEDKTLNEEVEDKTKFDFYAYKEPEFLKVIKKLRKKVDIVIKNREAYKKTEIRTNPDGGEKKYVVSKVKYELEFPEVYKIEGFDYLGGLTAKDGTKTFFSETETELFKKVSDDLDFKCYHCNKKIPTRLSKLYFKKTDTGEIVSFGTKCVQNYFGIDIWKKLKWASNVLDTLSDFSDEEGFGGGWRYYSKHSDIIDFLIGYFELGKIYISKAKAEISEVSSTAGICSFHISPPKRENLNDNQIYELEHYFDDLKTTPEEIEKIKEEIYKFYENRKANTDFDYNLKSVFGSLGDKLGLLAYGVYLYYKEKKEAEELKLGKKFIPIYFPDEEVENLKVACHSRNCFEGQYGTVYIVNFRSDKHNLVWFTNSGKIDFIKEGGEYLIKKAKVISREEYKGFKNTKIKCRYNWIEERKG